MNRRDLMTVALLALPELTAPSTPDERLTAAVEAWRQAQVTLADSLDAYHAAQRQLATARDVTARRLRLLVEGRVTAREEMRAAERALEEAEARLETAARLSRGGA